MTDAVIICLDQAHVVCRSARRLLKEGNRVIIVDNGSEPEHTEQLVQLGETYPEIKLVLLGENTGPSVGRNAGLDYTVSERVFLLDGDILYIPGAIAGLSSLMDSLPDAGCVGVHNVHSWDGTRSVEEADPRWPTDPAGPLADFPMAWTQFGLFDGELLRRVRFYAEGVFGVAGNGYEDNFLYLDILKAGLKSYYVPNVLYYHEAHGGQDWLTKHGMPNHNEERRTIFNAAAADWLLTRGEAERTG